MEGHHGMGYSSPIIQYSEEEEMDLRRGPWTVEEDLLLVSYIANHGEGRWNSLAHCAGLKRTGKSCRLRWLNYLRPDVRRGNITPEEQLLILELHSRLGNRWSKIAQYLPGRTDNEIKNYWRTRVQKHAKQLQCDVNSKRFKDVMRYLWMPRLLEKIRAASGNIAATATATAAAYHGAVPTAPLSDGPTQPVHPVGEYERVISPSPESSSMAESSSDSLGTQLSSPPWVSDCLAFEGGSGSQSGGDGNQITAFPGSLPSPWGYTDQGLPDFDQGCWVGGDMSDNLWSADDIWFLQQQL